MEPRRVPLARLGDFVTHTLGELSSGPELDIAVIGGGINGCAVALEAATRGLRVALFEASDFGFGTTWRSTKLIHGGLRYLEHGDVRLVFESLRERAWLLKTRPHLVTPQRFLLPQLPWSRRPKWQLRAGLTMYDVLALYRGVPRHRGLSDRRLHELAPFLPPETRGGFAFYDARLRSPERLTLELALEARRAGADVYNHAPVTRILVRAGRVAGVEVRQGPVAYQVPARLVVNAAGPWVDAVNALTGEAGPALLGVTRGSHIALELGQPLPRDAVFSTARRDGRVFFAVPQEQLLLVGTTDDRYEGDPGAVMPTAEDIDYLLEEAAELLPGLRPTRDKVRYAYAGLRPLPEVAGGPEAAITRRHDLVDHGERGGPRGLVSAIGGKLSTFRPLAREVVDRAGHGVPAPVPELARVPWRDALRAADVPRAVKRHLRTYGDAAAEVLAGGTEVLCPHAGVIAGEIGYVVRQELAATLSDVLLRRTGAGWASCRGLCCHREVARRMAPLLGWDEPAAGREIAAFETDVSRHLPAVH
ncbi:MAG: glycerol-3-phosphate dehydrogenase/oxidase [Dehalococcoidia bacterium]|nr:glycerol-3-phosphate dehydrogenase/oxidase [Dehalococcoidia bacterium]